MKDKDKTEYIFVIDTDKYAGNFEREMTAYCTGMIGDCGVGDDEAGIFHSDFKLEMGHEEDGPFYDAIKKRANEDDDCPCLRPTSIWRGFEGHYNSVAIFFKDKPNKEQIHIIKERSATYAKKGGTTISGSKTEKIKILGYRILKETTTITEVKE